MVPLNVPVWFAIASILGPLGERLHRWTQVGQFGHLFDSRGRIGPVAMEGGELDKKYAERPPIDLLRPYDADKMTA